MGSGVRLYYLLILNFITCYESLQSDFQINQNKTEIKLNNNNDIIKSDKNNYNQFQTNQLNVKEIKDNNGQNESYVKNVPDRIKREDKGLPYKNERQYIPKEINDMLKGELVRYEYMETNEDLELVDPQYKLEEAIKISEKNSARNNNINGKSDFKYGVIANVASASRIKRSTELINSSEKSTATEIGDLLKAETQNKGDLDEAAGHHSKKWSKGGGHKFKKEHHSKKGHKGDKGYKTKHHHKKGEHEKHGKDEHKKHYKKNSGHKKKHHDQAEKYGEHHKKEKGHKGAKYGEKKGHKKGHKTKGYHHKFHKDEYKKEHKFYDDYHKKGHHDKHGHHHKHHAKKEGKHKKGGHHKSAYHKDQYGKKGHKEGGHYDQEHKGHKGKKGHKKYHEKHSDYGKKGGHKEGKKWGYSKKHKHGKKHG